MKKLINMNSREFKCDFCVTLILMDRKRKERKRLNRYIHHNFFNEKQPFEAFIIGVQIFIVSTFFYSSSQR